MVELEIEERESKKFQINEKIAKSLEVTEDDLLLAQNPINNKTIVGKTELAKIESNKIGMDPTSFESIGLDQGFKISVWRYDGEIKKLKEVKFGIEKISKSERDPLSYIKENEDEFIDFISPKICTKHTEFIWDSVDLLISLESTYPELKNDEVGDFTELKDFSYSWGGSELKSFDGVLLVDLSGSMDTKDLSIKGVDWLIERINKSISGKNTTEFLENIRKEQEIKRADGATLCSLIYLVQKVGRGVGDKISIIPFSDSASTVSFDGENYFSSAMTDASSASENIIQKVRYHPRGKTNISEGFDKAIDTIKNFDRGKMKMIVLLTDGKPHPPSIDSPEEVLDLIEKRIKPRRDVIVNTIGLGDDVEHHLLDEIAKKTGGEYTYVNSLEGLTQAYSRYATNISVKSTSFS